MNKTIQQIIINTLEKTVEHIKKQEYKKAQHLTVWILDNLRINTGGNNE